MGTMIRQVFDIPKYGWTVTVYYAVTGYDVRRIMRELERLGCGGNDLHRAYANLSKGVINTGLTYSNVEERETLVVISRTSSAAQFQNSLDHEKGHLCRHISQAMHIDPYGEEAEYLAGYVGQRMFEVARMFLCDTCRRNLFSRPLKDALLLNSQHINAQFALKYLQVFVSLQSETCRYYDKKDLSAALLVQFVGRPTEPQTSLVSARRQD